MSIMKKLMTGFSVLALLFVFASTPGCGEQEYVDPGEVPEVEIDLGDDVPPLGGDEPADDSGDSNDK